jgi:hypothetical protein
VTSKLNITFFSVSTHIRSQFLSHRCWFRFLVCQSLAVASLGITFLAMMVHTRSPWLTLLGLLQIIFGIPLAYFVYTFIAGLDFFPFLNFIGLFVAAALGADDLFVAVDKFKNARIANPKGSTEDIAAVAFPDAASAMLLTTSTTAVAFFATCICPVPPILCFVVYCGLMIVFNYVMNILLVFPGLCLYDIWLQGGSRNWCVALCGKKPVEEDELESSVREATVKESGNEEPEQLTLIHRILTNYYKVLNRFRWAVLVAFIVAMGLCIWTAANLKQPNSLEVSLLPEDDPLQEHARLREFTLYSTMFAATAKVQIVFGLQAGDTGPQNKPDIYSKLLLDETFNPKTEDAQLYLRNLCGRLFAQDFVSIPYTGYMCPFNEFDDWLGQQFALNDPSEEYTNNCAGSSSLPVPEDSFDQCIIAWSKLSRNTSILQDGGVVKIMSIDTKAKISYKISGPLDIGKNWEKFENFLLAEASSAPAGTGNPFHCAHIWWWWDTSKQMLNTAIGAAGIAIAFSTIIILMASRSIILTIYAEISILYVLAAATASLVGLGWELGFLESVCFAILVGISCDFILHFGHAYIHYSGSVTKEERTKYAVVHMGPSILAASFTTISAASVMLFCEGVFFTKFAVILFVTIGHATIGSFVVFLLLNNLFGPSEPTKFIDSLIAKVRGKSEEKLEKDKKLEDLVLTPEDNAEARTMN